MPTDDMSQIESVVSEVLAKLTGPGTFSDHVAAIYHELVDTLLQEAADPDSDAGHVLTCVNCFPIFAALITGAVAGNLVITLLDALDSVLTSPALSLDQRVAARELYASIVAAAVTTVEDHELPAVSEKD